MTNARNYIILILVIALSIWAKFAYSYAVESPKERADRINLKEFKRCLDSARSKELLEEALSSATACTKSPMIQVIDPTSWTATLAPVSEVPKWISTSSSNNSLDGKSKMSLLENQEDDNLLKNLPNETKNSRATSSKREANVSQRLTYSWATIPSKQITAYYMAREIPKDACEGWENTPKSVILHYTATKPTTTVSSIGESHKNRFWVDYFIAYHYLIKADGSIVKTRPESCGSISVQSEELNTHAIHIAYIGDDKPNAKQLESLVTLTRDVQNRYSMPRDALFGHADIQAKNHKESLEGMFWSKDAFVKLLRLKDSITIYGKTSPELTYMWHAWWDADFIGTIFAESRMNNATVGDCGNSIGYCQIHKGYQPWWYEEYQSLKTMQERLNYCHEKYVYSSTLKWWVGSRFHWFDVRGEHIKNIVIK